MHNKDIIYWNFKAWQDLAIMLPKNCLKDLDQLSRALVKTPSLTMDEQSQTQLHRRVAHQRQPKVDIEVDRSFLLAISDDLVAPDLDILGGSHVKLNFTIIGLVDAVAVSAEAETGRLFAGR